MAENLKLFLVLIASLLVSFLLSKLFTKFLIKYFTEKRRGQVERGYLESHKVKEGTPSMGGIAFFLSTLVTYLLASFFVDSSGLIPAVMLGYIGFFLIGFIDDTCKLFFKSYAGLKGKIRILLEVLVATYVIYLLKLSGLDLFSLIVPISNVGINLGLFFFIFLVFIIVGSANAVNLTDGLDGLVSGLLMISIAPFLLLALNYEKYDIALLLMCQTGAILGFLRYNFHPAKIFMGDCGSLSIGALIAISAICLKAELILLVAGFIFVAETLSVIIQVGYFKLTGKRIFLMSPLHHHFEKKGWQEWKVVMLFYLAACLFSLLAIILGVI